MKLPNTLCNAMHCSPPGSSVHGESPGKNTGVGCHALLQGSSQPRDQTQVYHIAGGFFTIWASREALISSKLQRLSQGSSFLVSYQFSKFLPASCFISRRYCLIPQRIRQSSHSQSPYMMPGCDLLSSFHRLTSLDSLVPENLKTD